ncbi:hypothetical protein TWF281_000469 [Arthrobotrys megalospora]
MQAPGQLYIWSAEVWGEGQAGLPSETVANVTRCQSADISLSFRYFDDLTSTEDTLNTITIHVTLRQYGVVRPFRVNPFKRTFKEKPPLWTPTFGADDQTLPLNMAARKRILAVELVYPALWTVLEDGMAGYWNLRETHPTFRSYGDCSKFEIPGITVKERSYANHSASIVIASHIGGMAAHPICITRYDHVVKTRGSSCDLEFGLGRVLSHARNQFSLSSHIDTEGNRRLVMTEVGRGFTILEFNLSKVMDPYWERQEQARLRVVSQFDKRIEQKLNEPPIKRRPSLDAKGMEELAGLFQSAIRSASREDIDELANGGGKGDKQPESKFSWPFLDRFTM